MAQGVYWHRIWAAYVVLALGLALSLLSYRYVQQTAEAQAREQFETAARMTRSTLNQQLGRYIDTLLATRGFLAASDDVTRDEWKTYTNSINLEANYPGVQAIGFAKRVEPADLPRHVEKVRAQTADIQPKVDYNVSPGGARDIYFPIVYIEPFNERNRLAFGFDMYSDPVRREAMDRAATTGLPAASGRVRLKQEVPGDDEQTGFLIYVPVYRAGAPTDTPSARRAALDGFVYSPYRAGNLIRGILADRTEATLLNFQVFDGNPAEGQILFDSRGGDADPFVAQALPQAPWRMADRLELGGRQWELRFVPATNPGAVSAQLSLLVLLGGFLISWLLFGLSWLQIRGRLESERATAEIERSQHALRASESRYRLKIDQSPLAVQTFSPDGVTLSVNPAWERLWGVKFEDLGNYTVLEDPELKRRGVDGLIRRAFAGEAVTVGPIYYEPPELKEGIRPRSRWVRTMLYPVTDELGNVREVVLMHEDFTERKAAEEELRHAKEEAERANKAKDQFLAVLSHELRNPLAPVLMMVDMLESGAVNPAQMREAIDVIRRNVELEARLIDDLLDITRIARGKLHLDLRPTDVHTVLSHALEICEAEVKAKRLKIDVRLGAAKHHVMADAARLQQVLWNLVKNAVKFTPEGGSVVVSTRNDTPGGGPQEKSGDGKKAEGLLVIEVQDSGIGIEHEKLARIFDAFEQADRSITQRFGGLGLGLAISRALVEGHRGTIAATSEGAGKGATFSVTLPTVPAESAARAPAALPVAPAKEGGVPVRVLLVEDQADARRALQMLLQRAGYEVRSADSATVALETASEWDFDLLLSDVGLPDASGLELVRQIRAFRKVPAIALTGLGMEEDIRAALDAGFATHITKPVQFDRLVAEIRELMDREAKEAAS